MKTDSHKCGSDPAPGRSTIKTAYRKGDYHGITRRENNRRYLERTS